MVGEARGRRSLASTTRCSRQHSHHRCRILALEAEAGVGKIVSVTVMDHHNPWATITDLALVRFRRTRTACRFSRGMSHDKTTRAMVMAVDPREATTTMQIITVHQTTKCVVTPTMDEHAMSRVFHPLYRRHHPCATVPAEEEAVTAACRTTMVHSHANILATIKVKDNTPVPAVEAAETRARTSEVGGEARSAHSMGGSRST